MVGDAVEPLAPAGAVEVEAEGGRAGAEGRPDAIEHGLEIVVGCPRVADLELDRLSDEDGLGERDRAALLVESGQAPHDKVAAAERGLADIDRQAREDARTRHPLGVVWHALDRLAQDLDRWPAADRVDRIRRHVRHHVRLADRLAGLGDADDRRHRDREAGQGPADHVGRIELEGRHPRRDAADDRHRVEPSPETKEQVVRAERRRVGKDQEAAVLRAGHVGASGELRAGVGAERLPDGQDERPDRRRAACRHDHDGDRGHALGFAALGEDARAAAADDRAGTGDRAHRPEELPALPVGVGRREDEGHVRARRPARLERRAGRQAGGLVRAPSGAEARRGGRRVSGLGPRAGEPVSPLPLEHPGRRPERGAEDDVVGAGSGGRRHGARFYHGSPVPSR